MGINCEAEQKEGERVGKWINHFDFWIKKSDLLFLGHDKELSEPSSAVMLINNVVHAYR